MILEFAGKPVNPQGINEPLAVNKIAQIARAM